MKLTEKKQNKSIISGMLGSEIDFIVLDFDFTAEIAIGSRLEAMNIRAKIEISKLKINDVAKVRIIAVGTKNVLVDLYGIEVGIKAEDLKHTFIVKKYL